MEPTRLWKRGCSFPFLQSPVDGHLSLFFFFYVSYINTDQGILLRNSTTHMTRHKCKFAVWSQLRCFKVINFISGLCSYSSCVCSVRLSVVYFSCTHVWHSGWNTLFYAMKCLHNNIYSLRLPACLHSAGSCITTCCTKNFSVR